MANHALFSSLVKNMLFEVLPWKQINAGKMLGICYILKVGSYSCANAVIDNFEEIKFSVTKPDVCLL